ncbi:MAG: hypothetical protein KGK01_11650 [Bradyrhizobium sp.]|uniref:hypothetical protein n=1 Tax=Bradyrhizobium sp. TaxID=376 RepID=UPI001C2A3BB6|nr:hypothetical protein [Bradyrhizobium sp.]MBU6464761.1 hypothetical protein [Pseudomonadota bacterium]MDE2069313.1 hypothetical protein [Bradyrhizobium sp.]MDE2243062.1 hypothetical protein [Bradyrhizobium sp.]MDE2472096.1 hypothetical protein [Bradyrhizobium sp.]
MTGVVVTIASLLVLVAATPSLAGEQTAKEDCISRIQKLDTSNAEGQERLDEKNAVIAFCSNQYKHDRTIAELVKACARYEEQPVIKQQAVAECQLAAFGYAEALRTLKADYGK